MKYNHIPAELSVRQELATDFMVGERLLGSVYPDKDAKPFSSTSDEVAEAESWVRDIVMRYNEFDGLITAARAWCCIYEDKSPVPAEARFDAYLHTKQILVNLGIEVCQSGEAA